MVMATLIVTNPEVYQSNLPMETIKKFILNGQSWKQGQLLFTNTSDLLKACASDADAGTGGIKYFALSDQTDPGNSTTLAEVGVLTEDIVFGVNELDGTVAATDVGSSFGVNVTANVLTLDIGDVTNVALTLVDLMSNLSPAKYNIADVKAKVLVKVRADVLTAAQVA
jgi:hypothetical protein